MELSKNQFKEYAEKMSEGYNISERLGEILVSEKLNQDVSVVMGWLGIAKKTYQNHRSRLKEEICSSVELRDVTGPHPWDEYEIDPHLWEFVVCGVRERSDGSVVELKIYRTQKNMEYLLVKKVHEETESAGGVRTVTERRSFYDGDDLAHRMYHRPYDNIEEAVFRFALVERAGVDPKSSPEEKVRDYDGDEWMDVYDDVIDNYVYKEPQVVYQI